MKRCPKCAGIYSDEIKICDDCKVELVDKKSFSKASYDLREKESQKIQQYVQIDTINNNLKPEPQTQYIPKCPICQSTSLSKISTAGKVTKIAMFGIFGMGDNGKTWKCNNCGSKF